MGGLRFADGIYTSPRPNVNLPDVASLTELLFRADVHGPRAALIDAPTGRAVSASELRDRAVRVAAGLRGIGVGAGDVIMLLSPNSILYPVVVLGAMLLGGVVTTVNPVNTRREVAKQAEDSGSRFVLTVSSLAEKVAGLGLPLVLLDDLPTRGLQQQLKVFRVSEFFRAHPPRGFQAAVVRRDDTAVLLYSSGTTGTSKGVILTHENLVAAAVLHAASGPEREEGEVYLCVIPMFHVFGFVIVTCTQLYRGVPIVVMPSFDFQEMLAAVERYKITHTPFVPPIIIGLSKSPLVARFNVSSLREIGSGAAPLGKEVISACISRFPSVKLRQGYGLTESTAVATVADPDDPEHYGSAGLISANTKLKVIDVSTGRSLPPNKQGEVWLSGPTIMRGYLGNDKATSETLDSDGWLHTGDLGYVDDSGNLYVVDRIKELIKYKGYQVAPAELEALLLSHPEILDAAVIPFPDEEAGQVPVAVVVRGSGSSLSESGVMSFVAEQVAPYKKVRRVMFADAIPKSASGKILRRELIQKTMPSSRL